MNEIKASSDCQINLIPSESKKEPSPEAQDIDPSTPPHAVSWKIPEARQLSPNAYSFQDITVELLEGDGRYGLLGSGTFAKVVRAIGDDGAEYAVRKPTVIDDPWYRTRNSKLLEALNLVQGNPNALPCLAFFKDPKTGFITTIFPIATNSLGSALRTTVFSNTEKMFIMKDIFNGIFYLHNTLKQAHLDIKEDNLLIMPDNRIVLCDFDSLSPLKGPIHEDGVVFTTADYVAPEAREGWNIIMFDLKSPCNAQDTVLDRGLLDVWAAAVVVQVVWGLFKYSLLKQRFPFENCNPSKHLLPIFQSSVSETIEKIYSSDQKYPKILMENLLQINPKKRWSSSQALEEINRLLKG